MGSKPAEEAASAPLEYQTWFLKVSIHCEGCRRKVKKVLQSIDGVFTTTIDQQQQKVTVTGSVAVETLLRKLLRAGKHAEIWPQSPDANAKISPQPKKITNNGGRKHNTEKTMEKNHSSSEKKKRSTERASSNKNSNKESKGSKTGEKSPEKSPAGDNAPPGRRDGGGGGGGSGNKKKKKKNGLGSGSSGAPAHTGVLFQQFENEGLDVGREMGEVNLIPTRQQAYLYDAESGYPPVVYVAAAYNNNRMLYPSIGRMGGYPCYYVAPTSSPYMCGAGNGQDSYYELQSRPLVSFEIFSDENANGCSIM